jgi:uncharacterized protein (DUF1800 family)
VFSPAATGSVTDLLSREDAAHLLRRAGFGGTAAEIDHFAGQARDQAVDALMGWNDGDGGVDMSAAAVALLRDNASDGWMDRYAPLQQWLYTIMATDAFPLREKLMLFWHGHFCSQLPTVGDYVQLVKEVSLQPAMLIYLDNETSRQGYPNVNFARELMELFTLGVGNYTEADIHALANAFTGYTVDRSVTPPVMIFNATWHDGGAKTYLGTTANYDGSGAHGTDVIDRMFDPAHPERMIAARFIAKKLFEFFAYESADAALVDDLANTFAANNLSVGALVKAILTNDAFYTTTARQGRVRSPVEWFVAALRATQVPAADAHPEWFGGTLGQELLNPPNVAGWKLNDYWISTAGFWAKGAPARQIAASAQDRNDRGVASWLPILDTGTPPVAAQAAFDAAGLVTVSAQTRQAIEAFITEIRQDSDVWSLRFGLIQALILSPEFQLA